MDKTVRELGQEQIKKYKTQYNTFEDFPVSTQVKIISPFVDHHFFYGETGEVIENTSDYLGIRVKFDKPRHYEGGAIQKSFQFNPKDLCFKKGKKMPMKKCNDWGSFKIIKAKCPYCKKELHYNGSCSEGEMLQCISCKKKFKLGSES